ncbi:MAG: adenosylcobinamide-phosphate synthase CbiB [Microcoleaceae cyanobacterium]
MWSSGFVVLLLALLLDYLLADPQAWLHPVQVMGWIIQHLSQIIFQSLKSPLALRVSGIFLGGFLVIGSGVVSWGFIQATEMVSLQFPLQPLLTIGLESLLLASCFAGRSLRNAALSVLQYLAANNLAAARQQLSFYVGRDTDDLSEAEILRAVLETVSENATDGVMAPLFYGMVGLAIPGIGAVPLAFAYKASSTLDSMVGYREAPYTDLGWFSAKLEDILTWLPCRLTVLTIAILSGRPRTVLQLCWRDAVHDPSPNAGWSECAYAAALGVQLGGANRYKGITKHKPYLGEPHQPITRQIIHQALRLTRHSIFAWYGVVLLMQFVTQAFNNW